MHPSFSHIRRSAALLCCTLLIGHIYAQDPTPAATFTSPSACEIDLDTAIIGLGEARTNATKGDQEAALKIIQTVRQQLQDIETRCGVLPDQPTLTERYTAPDDLFTFDYPSGWSVNSFKASLDWKNTLAPLSPTLLIPLGGSVMLLNTPAEGGNSSTVLGSTPQKGSFVFISVGHPLHILESTGLYNQDMAQTFVAGGFTLETLGQQFIPPLSPLGDVTQFSLSKVEAQRPTLALDLRDTSAHLYMLLVTIDKDKNLYAALIGAASGDELAGLAPLMSTVADTVQVPEK